MRTAQISNNQLNGDENMEQVREMVLESYHDIAAGKGRECNEFFDELEQRYSNT